MKKKLLAALIELRDQGPRRPTLGICYNACLAFYMPPECSVLNQVDTDGVYDTIADIANRWPEHSGLSETNPVGDLNNYDRDTPLWENPRRHALLDFLIQELSK